MNLEMAIPNHFHSVLKLAEKPAHAFRAKLYRITLHSKIAAFTPIHTNTKHAIKCINGKEMESEKMKSVSIEHMCTANSNFEKFEN